MGGRGGRIFKENGHASKLPIFEDERRIKQPSIYNTHFLSELGLTEHLSGAARANLAQHEKAHYLDHKEQMLILDPNGNKVLEKKGEQTNVGFDGDLAKNNILSHNHPCALPILSPVDIDTFISTGALEIRATGLAGQVTRLERPPL